MFSCIPILIKEIMLMVLMVVATHYLYHLIMGLFSRKIRSYSYTLEVNICVTHFCVSWLMFIKDCNVPKDRSCLLYSVLQYWLH